MTEGATPAGDRPSTDPQPQGSAGDETVAFDGAADLPDPLPAPTVRPAPATDVVDGPTAGETEEGASPWRSPSTRPRSGGLGPPPAVAAGPPAPRRRPGDTTANALTIVAVGGVVVLVVVIILMAVVLGDDDDAPASATSVPTVPPVTEAGAGGDLPAGLLCRDLLGRGLAYEDAVAYWLQQGRPGPMDEDLDGIPCETVYPARDVELIWGPRLEDDGIEPGLLCRDLRAEELDYSAAVAYWLDEGRPERMDEDRDGIPCETVYPTEEVDDFWT
ncbi:hypothetical protein HC251_13760 [Iamia sp. SCSIO 61187]|uniref:hypothetical protein n=1 Tax=Iamia sp. SCSIO 61187 TaxID=2722752 RepID=UPI001C63566C|nr:hypothetical protein [Iamia sp. SCSIO 61187]QYG93383.1 hypothetical protein HC251_13760 [Iamia sp. SCSIO 61187]